MAGELGSGKRSGQVLDDAVALTFVDGASTRDSSAGAGLQY